MKNLVKISLTVLLLCSIVTVNGQSQVDLGLLFGQTNAGGTARIMGMGGAQISLGGDPSLANTNPAGLGMANRSSISISGAMHNYYSLTDFYGERTPDWDIDLNIPQLGLIYHHEGKSGNFKGGSFAFNYTRNDNYNGKISYQGQPNSRLMDFFLNSVDGLPTDVFASEGSEYNTLLGLAWYTYLIDTIWNETDQALYYDSYAYDEWPDIQGEEIDFRGKQNQWNFSYGGNYDDRLFFGFGLAVLNIDYASDRLFFEGYSNGSILDDVLLKEELRVRGSGFNASLGLIGRPLDYLQVGLSYTTPTLYDINDEWTAYMDTYWNNFQYPPTGEIFTEQSFYTDTWRMKYRITEPSRLAVGATGFFGKHGFVTADLERVDYGAIRLNSSNVSMTSENQEVTQRFGSALNFRAGGEFRYDMFRFRGGYAFYDTPFSVNADYNGSQQIVSAGFGIRKKHNYFDFAIFRKASQAGNYPYLINGQGEFAQSTIKQTTAMITIGWNM